MYGNRVRHRVRQGVCALLTAALLSSVWGPALPVGAVTQSEIDALKARQAESQERQDQLEQELSQVEADRDAAQEQRRLLGQQLAAILFRYLEHWGADTAGRADLPFTFIHKCALAFGLVLYIAALSAQGVPLRGLFRLE